ncbi:acyl carrier protein [Pelistega indica]|uniref:Acyl carrier protein n=1 Tax=Pelistega indica TaxID=1414851 RepID=V8G419_9BURK|nr:acyl carrier protein [Pelistega indica]ETD71175.1 acyl carrier protein [Pelistega indica]
MKKELITIVSETLGIPENEVPYDTNLISVGLHSLALMSIAEKLTEKYDRNIKFSALMANPTIEGWEALIKNLIN